MVTKSLTCHGTLFGREMGTPRGQAIVEDLLRQLAAGAIRMPIDRVFPLSEAAAAHRYAEQAHPFGRVLHVFHRRLACRLRVADGNRLGGTVQPGQWIQHQPVEQHRDRERQRQ